MNQTTEFQVLITFTALVMAITLTQVLYTQILLKKRILECCKK